MTTTTRARAAGLIRLLSPLLAALVLATLLASCGGGDDEQLRIYLTRFDRFHSETSLHAYSVPGLRKLERWRVNRMAARVCPAPDRGSLWLSGEIGENILIFDTLADSSAFSVNVAKPATGGAFSPDGRWFLVGNSAVVAYHLSESFATLIDVHRREVVAAIPVGEDPRAACFSPDSRRGFVVNTLDGTLSVIDVERAEVTETVPTAAGAVHAALDPRGRWIYVAGLGARLEDGSRGAGEVVLHALPDLEILARLDLALHPSRVTPYADGDRIIVSEMRSAEEDVAWLRFYDVRMADGVGCELRCELDVGSNPLSGDLSPDETLFALIDFDMSQLVLVDVEKERVLRAVSLPDPGKGLYSVDAVFARH